MAYRKPMDLDGFIQLMPKADMRVKTQLAEDLVTFLSDENNSIVCMDLGVLIDNLMPWLTGSHFKIAQKSLEAFTELIKRLGSDFNAYIPLVLPHVIDRLGDSKDTVREKAQLLLQNIMEHRVMTPQQMLDKLSNTCLKHKNAKVREEFLQTIVNTLHEYGTSQLSVRTYIQLIAHNLLGDPAAVVRDSAVQTLVEIYKHVGDKLRLDLRRMDEVPAAKLSILEQKFDQIKREGLLLKSAGVSSNNGHDESDNINVNILVQQSTNSTLQREPRSKLVKRIGSAASRAAGGGGAGSGTSYATSSGNNNMTSNDNATDAGAVTMEIFEASFELVPTLNLFTQKDVDDLYKNIMSIISDKNSDWEKRVESFKKLRALMLSNSITHAMLALQMKDMAICFADVLKEELRSQVIREACITIAYMSKLLRQKFELFCSSILDHLILLIQNSAKVIASSSTIALKYIIKYVHAPKLIKLLTENLNQSKSKDIRANLCDILCLLLEEWPTKYMERHATLLRDTIKKSLSDADNQARMHSRRAYWLFRQHFPDMADYIYNNVDVATQRALDRDRDGGSGSGGGGATTPSGTYGTSSMTNTNTKSRFLRSPGAVPKPAAGARSISAVDTAAAHRAKIRNQYVLYARKKSTGGTNTERTSAGGNNSHTPAHQQHHYNSSSTGASGSLPRPRYGMSSGGVSGNSGGADHGAISSTLGRQRNRAGVSQSQPTSRSTSPSSRLREQQCYKPLGTIPKKASGIPRSLANSRETSPTRVPMKRSIYGSGGGGGGSTLINTSRRTPERANIISRPLAAARMLQQSREAESVLADAFSPEVLMATPVDYAIGYARYGRKLMSRDESDDSEASSVCSERSYESGFTRGLNSSGIYSLSGSRQRLDWSTTRTSCDDIDTIIQYCASTHWSERKDGLNSLSQYLSSGQQLTHSQLQAVLDMFRKMFIDNHTKVYSLFLDAVTELILVYAKELHDWLFILLTRLFTKLGTELLNSMTGKIWKTLQVVHEYFPTELQMRDILRILSDAAQTPTIKSRIAMLKFLANLSNTYCKPSDFPDQDSNLPVERAVLKIVQICGDQKSLELRNQARYCLIALYNLNAPQMTRILSTMPKNSQDTAKNIIQTHLRQSSQNSNANSPSCSPVSSSSPKPLQSPSVLGPFASLQSATTSMQSPLQQYAVNSTVAANTAANCQRQSRQSSIDAQELHYSDIDAVQHNIHKTSEEIRHYTSAAAAQEHNNPQMITPISHNARQYHSLSGSINNNNNNNNNDNANGYNGYAHDVIQQFESNCNSKTQSTATTESNTPESSSTMRLEGQIINSALQQQQQQEQQQQKISQSKNTPSSGNGNRQLINYNIADNGELLLENGMRESEIINIACALNAQIPLEQIQTALNNLSACIKDGICELPNKHFRKIMKMLLDLLESKQPDIMIAALSVLGKIVRSERMKTNWINFLELILLRIIDSYQVSKETAREIDTIIPRIAPALPLHAVIEIINPVIATSVYPMNLCAVKLLSELAERHGNELTESHLNEVFPNLARLTDNDQSMVRKAAVFCIVKLYFVMGEDKVKPKFSMLNPSKVRLLNVYIDKQRNSSGGGSSTKNSSAASSS